MSTPRRQKLQSFVPLWMWGENRTFPELKIKEQRVSTLDENQRLMRWEMFLPLNTANFSRGALERAEFMSLFQAAWQEGQPFPRGLFCASLKADCSVLSFAPHMARTTRRPFWTGNMTLCGPLFPCLIQRNRGRNRNVVVFILRTCREAGYRAPAWLEHRAP